MLTASFGKHGIVHCARHGRVISWLSLFMKDNEKVDPGLAHVVHDPVATSQEICTSQI